MTDTRPRHCESPHNPGTRWRTTSRGWCAPPMTPKATALHPPILPWSGSALANKSATSQQPPPTPSDGHDDNLHRDSPPEKSGGHGSLMLSAATPSNANTVGYARADTPCRD